MKIRVLYADKCRGTIEDSKLADLATRGLIVAFYLPWSNEWVDVKNKDMMGKFLDAVGKKSH
jgi:hypothetical protein